MNKETALAVFESYKIRRFYDEKSETWFFSVVDIIAALTQLRIIQSVSSPKAEPIKLWLAKVGYERIQDMSDPARSLDRAREYWKKHGRSEKWIQQRMMGQETRNKLTDYWKEHDIKEEQEYAILTNIIHQEWSGVSVKEHKAIKGLKIQNLRNHMCEAELIFTALAELSTRQIMAVGKFGLSPRGGPLADVAIQ